ncbi:MAG: permease-like cell division protein FtsX [Paludibacter sp.]|nr:permease-like cell division protein FtsX [Paludibacter sp.]MDD4198774.1 permease-like cell division protein FtsX [Paludibacter sp.]MDD4428311.1 permease-like cell division protein FtsX [Paludibacter sp.]
MNDKSRKGKYRIGNVHLTSTISMSLVLFLIGLVSLLLFVARDLGTQIRENISLSVVLNENISAAGTTRIQQYLERSKYVKSVNFISKEDALKEHIQTMGDDPEKYLGYNPLMGSFEIKLKADYANKDSVEVIESHLKVFEGINRIAYQKDIVNLVNDNIARISFMLLAVATILMLISITLMNNTIRVSIYSNRFLINTMKLVGATPWFIRKPYIIKGMTNGFIASLVSLGMLAVLLLYVRNNIGLNLFTLHTQTLVEVSGIVILLGIVLTAMSSYAAVGKYLRMQTNDMYFV